MQFRPPRNRGEPRLSALRSDPRVICREKFNVRHMKPEDVGELVDIVVLDLSFISLTLILEPCFSILAPEGQVVCLIKPQFELERGEVSKSGIVRDPELHSKAVEKIRNHVEESLGKIWCGVMDSPIQGSEGNREFLAWLKH